MVELTPIDPFNVIGIGTMRRKNDYRFENSKPPISSDKESTFVEDCSVKFSFVCSTRLSITFHTCQAESHKFSTSNKTGHHEALPRMPRLLLPFQCRLGWIHPKSPETRLQSLQQDGRVPCWPSQNRCQYQRNFCG